MDFHHSVQSPIVWHRMTENLRTARASGAGYLGASSKVSTRSKDVLAVERSHVPRAKGI